MPVHNNVLKGWKQLAQILTREGVDRIGIEASGGYERRVVSYLRRRGFNVIVLQPVQVRYYARFRLKRAKNDKIDAALIAASTAALDQKVQIRDEHLAKLADHLTFVEQIEDDIVRIKTRLEHMQIERLKRLAIADLARLTARLTAELALIAKALNAHGDLARRFELVESVPGIGQRTAISLLVRIPELGRVSREEIASLAGLAPFDDDSGTHRGHRHIAGGRSSVRRSLYLAALPAAFRWNPELIKIYKRLTCSGKPHKVALVACARKLLTYANCIVERGTPWLKEGRPA